MPAKLPLEICMLVLDCIPTNVFGNWKRPFYDAALVCRSWTPHAQRKIFHQFIFKLHLDRWSPFPTRAFTRLAYLARHPHLAAHVMYLHFRTSPYVQPADVIASANLLAAIFPNVTGLILRSPEHLNALLDAFPIESIKTISVISNTRDVGEVKLPAHVRLASIHVQSSPGIMSSLLQALQGTSSTLSLTAATLLPFQITSTSWVSFVVGISTFQNLSSLVLDYPASFELANDPCKPFSLWVSSSMSYNLKYTPASFLKGLNLSSLRSLQVNKLDGTRMPIRQLRALFPASSTSLPSLQNLKIQFNLTTTSASTSVVWVPFRTDAYRRVEPVNLEAVIEELSSEIHADCAPLLPSSIYSSLEDVTLRLMTYGPLYVYPASRLFGFLGKDDRRSVTLENTNKKEINLVG
jgi:hypothetical protein